MTAIVSTAWIKDHKTIISGNISGMVGVIIGYPFDNIKTRMQTYDYKNISDCMQQTLKAEGVRGFFRGISVPIFFVGFLKAITFSLYEKYKKLVYPIVNREGSLRERLAISAAAGALTGGTMASFTSPLELIKVQVQLQRLLNSSTKPKGNFGVAYGIYKKKGFGRFYLGFASHFARDCVGTALYFGGYEAFKQILIHSFGSGIPGSTQPPWIFMVAGGLGGTLSWSVMFPIDLLKSRIQKEAMLENRTHKNIRTSFKLTLAQSGWRGFYTGLPATMIRAFPIHAMTFSMYEFLTKYIDEIQ